MNYTASYKSTPKQSPSNKNMPEDFGSRIRDARRSANLSQSELAEAIGVSDRSISAYEKNRILPPIEKLKKIADHTNYSFRFFVGENDPIVSVKKLLLNIEKELQEVKEVLKEYQVQNKESDSYTK